MVTETEVPVQTDPEPQTVETEIPAPVEEAEGAAPEPEAAAVPQVEVTESKPDYLTRAEWEKEKADVAARAAADALENDRRRRQTENARRAQQERRDQEDRAELIDTVKAAFGAKGIYEVPDDAVITAVDRAVKRRSDQLSVGALDAVDAAWDYLTAPLYGKNVDLDESAEQAAKRLGPKVQHMIDALRPAIEKQAREGYIAESELPAKVDAEIARRAAQGRQGKEELKRVEGSPASNIDRSLMAVTDRIIANKADAEDEKLWHERFSRNQR